LFWIDTPEEYHRDVMNSERRMEIVIDRAPARRLGGLLEGCADPTLALLAIFTLTIGRDSDLHMLRA
jgi:hypothetical protein